jgi:cobalt-zinc-cadmium resistance protein CzcA
MEILSEIRKYDKIIKQYNELGKETSQEIMRYAREAFDQGEIDFHVFISSLEEAFNLELNFLDNLYNYNQAVIDLNYLNLEE